MILKFAFKSGLRIRVGSTRISIRIQPSLKKPIRIRPSREKTESGSDSRKKKRVRILPNFYLIIFTFYFFLSTKKSVWLIFWYCIIITLVNKHCNKSSVLERFQTLMFRPDLTKTPGSGSTTLVDTTQNELAMHADCESALNSYDLKFRALFFVFKLRPVTEVYICTLSPLYK